MTTMPIEAPHKFIYVGDPRDLSVMTVGISSKQPYTYYDIKNDYQITEREKRGALRISMEIEGERHNMWITKFSKIDKRDGITIRFKRGFL